MGLDIIIKARTEKQDEIPACYGLSRSFCRLICDRSEMKGDIPELTQLFGFLGIDGSILDRANVWLMDSEILYGGSINLTKEEINSYYEKSWQPVVQFLNLFEKLYKALEKKPMLLQKLNLNYDWMRNYFEGFDEKNGDDNTAKNFGWDLRTIIEYLRKLEANSTLRFHFF
jgi:hypothetical protein